MQAGDVGMSVSKVRRKFDDFNLSGGNFPQRSKVKAATSWRCFDAQFRTNCPPRMNRLVLLVPPEL